MFRSWVFFVGLLATTACYFEPFDSPADATSGAVDDAAETDEPAHGGSSDDADEESGEAPPTDQPNGQWCDGDEECASGLCYGDNLTRACGECRDDDDCALGCTPPVFGRPSSGSECNAGAFGDGCQSDAACIEELMCADTFVIPGFVAYASCGECRDDEDCADDRLCVPSYDFSRSAGVRTCRPPGVLAVDDACDHLGSGDASCLSGICNTYWVSGLLELGVCGECSDDADCESGRCRGTGFDQDFGLIGSRCVR